MRGVRVRRAALDGVSASIDGDGRIVIGGPTVFAGYLRRPDLTAHTLVDGRVLTQDTGRFDASGRLVVLGRIDDDIVVSGGENVSLLAVETALNEQPGIVEAAAIAIPDDAWGQRVVAFIVARTSVREADVRQAIAANLDAHPPLGTSLSWTKCLVPAPARWTAEPCSR